MKSSFILVAAFGAAFTTLAGVGTYDAATQTLTYDVAAETTNTEAAAFSSYGTVTKVVKTGAGALRLTGDNSAYAGQIEIENGVFDVATATKFCTASATAYVRSTESGAGQFRISFTSAGQNSTHVYCNIHIAGVGPDGKGALYGANGGMGDAIFLQWLTLDADATVGGTTRFGFGAVLNDHTLTDAVTTEHTANGFTPGNGHVIYSGGHRFVVNGGFGGSAANTLTISKAGGLVCFWSHWGNPKWTLKFDESGYIASGDGKDQNANLWAGPVVIAKDKTLTLGAYNWTAGLSVGVSGVISGEGRVVCGGNMATMNAYLTGANTYTGGTTVQNNSTLYANADKSIPETGAITPTSGHLEFNMAKWSAAEVKKRLANVTSGDGSVNYYTASDANDDGGTGFAVTTDLAHIGHDGAGTFTTTGAITGRPTLMSRGGLWSIRSKAIDAELFYLSGGTIAFEETGDLWTSNRTSRILGSATAFAKVIVSNSVVGGKVTTSGSNWGAKTIIGESAGQRGVLHVTGERAAYTNYLWLGEASKSAGAVWQDGGRVLASCNSTADGKWGEWGYGAYDLAGGYLKIGHCENLGYDFAGVGILRMSDGTIDLADTIFVGSGGTGVVHVTGGTLSGDKITLGQRQWARSGGIGQSEMTIAGGLVSLRELQLGQRPAPAQSMLNLNGGVLKMTTAPWRLPKSGGETFYTEADQPNAWVNCNGGTMRMAAASHLFSTGALNRPTKVTLYERGLTVDMGNGDVTVGVPLEAPTGLGITAIALPADFPTTGWVGPQHVVIRGGSGYGATAITDFDPKTTAISKIIVTSPGQGYADGDVVTASMPNMANSAPLACAGVTLGALASGGLTVTNSGAKAGVCRITATNTYAGATCVAAGTMQLCAPDVIAASKTVRVAAGATLDLNQKGALKVDAFGGAGTVKGGDVEVARELVFDAAEVAAGKAMSLTGKLTLGADVTMRVEGGAADFPQRSRTVLAASGGIAGNVSGTVGMGAAAGGYTWTAKVSGGALRLVCGKGMMMILR